MEYIVVTLVSFILAHNLILWKNKEIFLIKMSYIAMLVSFLYSVAVVIKIESGINIARLVAETNAILAIIVPLLATAHIFILSLNKNMAFNKSISVYYSEKIKSLNLVYFPILFYILGLIFISPIAVHAISIYLLMYELLIFADILDDVSKWNSNEVKSVYINSVHKAVKNFSVWSSETQMNTFLRDIEDFEYTPIDLGVLLKNRVIEIMNKENKTRYIEMYLDDFTKWLFITYYEEVISNNREIELDLGGREGYFLRLLEELEIEELEKLIYYKEFKLQNRSEYQLIELFLISWTRKVILEQAHYQVDQLLSFYGNAFKRATVPYEKIVEIICSELYIQNYDIRKFKPYNISDNEDLVILIVIESLCSWNDSAIKNKDGYDFKDLPRNEIIDFSFHKTIYYNNKTYYRLSASEMLELVKKSTKIKTNIFDNLNMKYIKGSFSSPTLYKSNIIGEFVFGWLTTHFKYVTSLQSTEDSICDFEEYLKVLTMNYKENQSRYQYLIDNLNTELRYKMTIIKEHYEKMPTLIEQTSMYGSVLTNSLKGEINSTLSVKLLNEDIFNDIESEDDCVRIKELISALKKSPKQNYIQLPTNIKGKSRYYIKTDVFSHILNQINALKKFDLWDEMKLELLEFESLYECLGRLRITDNKKYLNVAKDFESMHKEPYIRGMYEEYRNLVFNNQDLSNMEEVKEFFRITPIDELYWKEYDFFGNFKAIELFPTVNSFKKETMKQILKDELVDLKSLFLESTEYGTELEEKVNLFSYIIDLMDESSLSNMYQLKNYVLFFSDDERKNKIVSFEMDKLFQKFNFVNNQYYELKNTSDHKSLNEIQSLVNSELFESSFNNEVKTIVEVG